MVLAVVVVAAAVQTVAGFGFSLLAVPLLSFAIDTKTAVVVASTLGLFTSSVLAWRGRVDVDRPITRRLVAGAVVGAPVGLIVLEVAPERGLKAALAVAVLLFVVNAMRRTGMALSSARGDVVAGAVSGVLSTSLSTNGPPLVMALHARGLPSKVFRASINVVFALSGALATVLFALAGRYDAEVAGHLAVAVPALVAGFAVGHVVRPRVPEAAFRSMVLLLLAATAVAAGLSALSG